jgi:hypothetical protein
MALFDPTGIEVDDPCAHNTATACAHCRQVRQLRDALFASANMARIAAAAHDPEHRRNVLRTLWKTATDAALDGAEFHSSRRKKAPPRHTIERSGGEKPAP